MGCRGEECVGRCWMGGRGEYSENVQGEVESEGDVGFLVLREVRCCAKGGEEEEEEEEEEEKKEEEEEVVRRLAFRCGAPSREEMIEGTVLVIGRVEGVRRVAGPRVPLVLTGIR